MTSNRAVSVSDLAVFYNSQRVLDLPELNFSSGKIHVLMGGNGAGKTTLLRCIAGLEKPGKGKVSVLGQDLYCLPSAGRQRVMRRMTFCFQKPYLFNASVRRNIEYGLRLRNRDKTFVDERVAGALNALGLSHLTGRNAQTLSAGESQRVSLARALALRPELVLLDEPIANVDTPNIERVEEAMLELHRQGATIIVATHRPEQAYRLSANVVRLEQGRLAPSVVENVFSAEAVDFDGAAFLVTDAGIRIRVSTDRRGPVRAAVVPAQIIVSTVPFVSSARNCLPGKVISLVEMGKRVAVSVDAGLPLMAHITTEAFVDLGITLGAEVHLTFKASSVVIY
jgi:molybdopterin-binding protein